MATRYWVGGGTNTQWNSTPTSNFSATSGGAPGASNPISTDDVIFDGVGVNANGASTFTAANTILSLTLTGYTGTITINTGITMTIAGNFTDNTNHSWTVSGTGKITLSATSTITSGGKTFPGAVTFTGSGTKTLSGNWVITGTLGLNASTCVLNATTNETLSCNGITTTGATHSAGSAKIILTGGTWAGLGALQNDVDLQGNVTLSNGGTGFIGKTLTYVSGSITTTGNTMTLAGSCTLNTNGISFENIIISSTATLTLNSLLTVSGTLTVNASVAATFAGTDGFIVANIVFPHITSTGGTQTFANGETYIITNSLTCYLARNGSGVTFTSDHGTNTAAITLQQGATCNVLANFTRIDASGGRPILTFNGTVTSSPNVFSYNDIMWKPVRGFGRGPRKFKISNRNKAVEYL